jgi:hypothetical protein
MQRLDSIPGARTHAQEVHLQESRLRATHREIPATVEPFLDQRLCKNSHLSNPFPETSPARSVPTLTSTALLHAQTFR